MVQTSETPQMQAVDTGRDNVLEINNLKTHFTTNEGIVRAVDGVTMSLERGKTLAVVGESGCGKSITARSVLQIVEAPGEIVQGEILFRRKIKNGQVSTTDIAKLGAKSKEMRAIRWKDISMIFQEPMSSFSPVHTVGNQIREAVLTHFKVSKEEANDRAVESLRLVGIPRPDRMVDRYPFQLSGGMRQRAMIAMALIARPEVLIADEPTTALDVTTQAQILDLIRGLQSELGMSLMMITHDLGVVAEMADDVAVMYLGTVAEQGTVDQIFHEPQHPYTRALLRSVPRVGAEETNKRLYTLTGTVPNPYNRPSACPFHTRCDRFMPGLCDKVTPPEIDFGNGHRAKCLLYTNAAKQWEETQGKSTVEAK